MSLQKKKCGRNFSPSDFEDVLTITATINRVMNKWMSQLDSTGQKSSKITSKGVLIIVWKLIYDREKTDPDRSTPILRLGYSSTLLSASCLCKSYLDLLWVDRGSTSLICKHRMPSSVNVSETWEYNLRCDTVIILIKIRVATFVSECHTVCCLYISKLCTSIPCVVVLRLLVELNNWLN